MTWAVIGEVFGAKVQEHDVLSLVLWQSECDSVVWFKVQRWWRWWRGVVGVVDCEVGFGTVELVLKERRGW